MLSGSTSTVAIHVSLFPLSDLNLGRTCKPPLTSRGLASESPTLEAEESHVASLGESRVTVQGAHMKMAKGTGRCCPGQVF